MPKKKAAKKSKKSKGEEWKHDHVSGSAHPDNNPPLQRVAEASDEAALKETQALDAMRQKEVRPDWAELPGGKPADPSKPAAEQKPKRTRATPKKASSPATDMVGSSHADKSADK